MKYSFHIHHIPGKELVTAGTLSRVPIRKPPTEIDKRLTEDLSLYVANIFKNLPASERKLEEIITQLVHYNSSNLLYFFHV